MGKSVAPRDESVDVEKRDGEEASNVSKRDMASFNRALQFAEAALTKGPKVQLGTGESGAGVGILVDNNVAAASKTTTRGKREVAASPRVKVTTMYVRSGIPACEYRPFSFTCLTYSLNAGKKEKTKEKQKRTHQLVGLSKTLTFCNLIKSSPER